MHGLALAGEDEERKPTVVIGADRDTPYGEVSAMAARVCGECRVSDPVRFGERVHGRRRGRCGCVHVHLRWGVKIKLQFGIPISINIVGVLPSRPCEAIARRRNLEGWEELAGERREVYRWRDGPGDGGRWKRSVEWWRRR